MVFSLVNTYVRAVIIVATALCATLGAGNAAVIDESAFPGREFSASWSAPTPVPEGYSTITGAGRSGAYDNIVLTGLPKGAQIVTLRFWAPEETDHSYAAGGTVMHSEEAFDHGWDGTLGGIVGLSHSETGQTVELTLGEDFEGVLYLALNFTYGTEILYSIEIEEAAPTDAVSDNYDEDFYEIAPVPLPAPGLLLGVVIGAMGMTAKRRAAKKQG